MVIALPRATLLWPAGLEDRLDEAARRAVLIHELAHLKRRDHLSAWLEVSVTCLWWWHPIVWWAGREIRQYAELACDAWVVAQLPAERSRYAKALVDVCEFISLAKPAAAPAVGMARGNRRSFERRLHMVLRQQIAARIPSVAWLTLIAAAVLVLPSFSTGQDSAGDPGISPSTTKSAGVESKPTGAATPAEEENTVGTTATEIDQPAASDTPSRPSNTTTRYDYGPAPKRFSDEELSDELRAITDELQRLRHKGKKPEQPTIHRVATALGQLFERFRSNGAPAQNVVREAFAWILRRVPNEAELDAWSQNIDLTEDAIERLIVNLLISHEFSDPEVSGVKRTPMPEPNLAAKRTGVLPSLPPHRIRQAKVQTLLRVVYDMPLDKAEILAKFLNDNVKGEIEARTDEEGLVVTAEAGIQRTVAGIVSLMTGEPVALDLGGGSPPGYATVRVPVYHDPKNPHATTFYAPAPVVQPGVVGMYQQGPSAARQLRTRTVIETDPTTGKQVPRTVLEERIKADEWRETQDPSVPRIYTPEPAKE
jgi:beta-lactamase regulating signal transducer with metallopeptidase domain